MIDRVDSSDADRQRFAEIGRALADPKRGCVLESLADGELSEKPWLDARFSHNVLDDGRLVVAHAGLKEEMHGRGSRAVREFALYGDTTGETDE